MKDLKQIIAKNISDLRQKSNMTQADLALRLNYSDKAVSKWERGESLPDISVLYDISKLFNVTLDWLVSESHEEPSAEAESKGISLSPHAMTEKIKKRVTNRIIVTCISILLVWLVATVVFVCLDIFLSGTKIHYICFAYSVPASAIVWLVFNSIWFDVRRNYYIVSILMWSLIVAIYLTLFPLGFNIWQLFILGVPGQTIIVLWSLLSFNKRKNHSRK